MTARPNNVLDICDSDTKRERITKESHDTALPINSKNNIFISRVNFGNSYIYKYTNMLYDIESISEIWKFKYVTCLTFDIKFYIYIFQFKIHLQINIGENIKTLYIFRMAALLIVTT